MEAWRFSSNEEWPDIAPALLPHPRCVDLDPRSIENIPMIGGCGFDLEADRWRINGVGLKQTRTEIHTYQAERRKQRERAGGRYGPSISGTPPGGVYTPVNQRDVRATSRRLYEGQRRGQYEDPSTLARTRNRRAELDAMRRNNPVKEG